MMRLVLLPFSVIYWVVMLVRDFLWGKGVLKAHALDAKVISVGNITWGGTGKTPAVATVANRLLKNGRKVAILIRGYGNDEKELLPRLIPGASVKVGRDRVKTGQEAIDKLGADTLLLDDGFQHRRLKRGLDIVCIDSTDPFGNRCMIPAGPMREGLGSLKRAGVFLLTKVDLVQDKKRIEDLEVRLKKLNPGAEIVKSVHQPGYFYKLSDEQLVDIRALENKNIALVSAIGSPRSFEKTISKLGLKFKKHFIFRDHHLYDKKDLKKISDYCSRNKIDIVLTTEKDAIKLRNTHNAIRSTNVLVLHIDLKITDNEQGFNSRLSRIYNS